MRKAGINDEIKSAIRKVEKFEWRHKNTILILVSMLLSYYILKSRFIHDFLTTSGSFGYVGSFIAGVLFPHGLTVVPAIASLFILSETLNPLFMAAIGALGAVISDYLIFRFIGRRMILGLEEVAGDFSKKLRERIERLRIRISRSKNLHHIIPIASGLIMASPLPDELVAVLFGSVRFKLKKFLMYAYIFHFIGILLIVTVGRVF